MGGTTGSGCKTLTSKSSFHVGVYNQELIKAVDFGSYHLPHQDRVKCFDLTSGSSLHGQVGCSDLPSLCLLLSCNFYCELSMNVPRGLMYLNTLHLWEDCRTFRRWNLSGGSGLLGVGFEETLGCYFLSPSSVQAQCDRPSSCSYHSAFPVCCQVFPSMMNSAL